MTDTPSNPTIGPPPEDLPVREALERYLLARQTELSKSSIQTYYYKLKVFVDWLEANGIYHVNELNGWVLDSWEQHRASLDLRPTTRNNDQKRVKGFVEYLERIDTVDPGLADKVHIPPVPDDAKSNEEYLAADDALATRDYYRTNKDVYGTREHAWFELEWHIGPRKGGIRALDIRDVHLDPDPDVAPGPFVEFHHRPETGTPLKNGVDGERPVRIPPENASVLEWYIDRHRLNKHDDYGRQPLLTTTHGRPHPGTPTDWSYWITLPCHHSPCPHGRDPDTCEYRQEHNRASGCPSSRSPHEIRSGSITWQRDLGFPAEVVAERVNATLSVIEDYYDQANQRRRMNIRRSPWVDKMTDHTTNPKDTTEGDR